MPSLKHDHDSAQRHDPHLQLVPATLDLTGPVPTIDGVPVYPIYGSSANAMIAPHHLDMLAESGIPPEHAAARGYETITDSRRLAELGVVKAARNCVPGLLIPLLRADGSTWGYQYRPDIPRWRSGKPVKYETPYQQRNGLDIPPGVGDLLQIKGGAPHVQRR